MVFTVFKKKKKIKKIIIIMRGKETKNPYIIMLVCMSVIYSWS